MPDADLIYSTLLRTHWTWCAAPGAMQYHFEATILSWGFIHV